MGKQQPVASVPGSRQPSIVLLEGRGATGLGQAVARRSGVQPTIAPARSLLGEKAAPAHKARRDGLSAALAALRQARVAYRELRFGDALRVLDEAQLTLLPFATGDEALQLLRQVVLQRMLNHLALEERDAAADALRLVSALGYAGPEPGELSPEVTAFVRGTLERFGGEPRGRLTIETSAPGAMVEVDGRQRGRAPQTLELPSGPHLVRLSGFGYRPHAQLQRAEAGQVSRVMAPLSAADKAQQAAQLLAREQAGQAASIDPTALASLLGPSHLWLDMDGAAGAHLKATLLWTGSATSRATRISCPAADQAAAVDCAAGHLRSLSGAGAARVTDGKPFYRRWWFWAVVGGAAAAGAGVGIYAATRTPEGVDVFATLR